uniref:Syntaxin-6_N domain-containing protein n=1 Tax=Loa loa TaxID=7209 RepID=A0A1I7W2X7_LOALO
MTSVILESIKPVRNRLINILQEVKVLDVGLPKQSLPCSERLQIHKARKRLFEEKIMRLHMCTQSLQEANDRWIDYLTNDRWIDYLQKALTTSRKKEEEEKYQEVTIGEHGIFNLIYEAKEAVITLTISQKEIDSEIQKLTQTLNQQHTLPTEVTKPAPPTYTNVNLPQLYLPVFNGDPRQWREFWSSFNAAVHSQTIPEIQKKSASFDVKICAHMVTDL